MNALGLYFKNIRILEQLTQKEEQDIVTNINNIEYRNKLIVASLGFVVYIARKYKIKQISLEELIAAGNEGLVIAAKRFDPNKGVRFITYAVWWIRAIILETLAIKSDLIRLPGRKKWIFLKINKFDTLTEKYKEDNKEILDIHANLSSFTYTPMEKTEVISPLNIEEILIHKDKLNKVKSLIDELPDRERKIIYLRYGIADGRERTFREIGKTMSLSGERTRIIEENIRSKLMGELLKHDLN